MTKKMSQNPSPKNKQLHLIFGIIMLLIGLYIVGSGIVGIQSRDAGDAKDEIKSSVAIDENYSQRIISPNGTELFIDRAESVSSQVQGLSGRLGMNSHTGMLFVYDEEQEGRCFHMPNMNFSIDIIWFDGQKQVVHIAENVSPESYPETFCPPSATQYVLELNAGKASEYGFVSGAQAEF